MYGNRSFAGQLDKEMYVAIPGDKWEAVVGKLAKTNAANSALGKYYSNRKTQLAAH